MTVTIKQVEVRLTPDAKVSYFYYDLEKSIDLRSDITNINCKELALVLNKMHEQAIAMNDKLQNNNAQLNNEPNNQLEAVKAELTAAKQKALDDLEIITEITLAEERAKLAIDTYKAQINQLNNDLKSSRNDMGEIETQISELTQEFRQRVSIRTATRAHKRQNVRRTRRS